MCEIGRGLLDVFRALADDDAEFDLPIELGRAARLFHRIVRAADRGDGLQKDDRLGRKRHADFGGVVAVVQADRDELRRRRHRRAKPHAVGHARQARRIDRCNPRQAFVGKHVAGNVLHMRGQVADVAVLVEKSRPFLACFAKPYKFHVRPPITVTRPCQSIRPFYHKPRGPNWMPAFAVHDDIFTPRNT